MELRPWRVSDVGALVAALSTDPLLARQLPFAAPDPAAARAAIAGPMAPADDRLPLAIEMGGTVIGGCSLTDISRRHETAWVSYWLAPEARGRGSAARAVIVLANWALQLAGLHRLELGYRTDNPASGAVARAAGFEVEGVERDRLRYGDRRFDVVRCARLATDPFPPAPPATRLTLP